MKKEKLYTKEDLRIAFNAGMRTGSVNGMRVARGYEMNVTFFDEWFKNKKQS